MELRGFDRCHVSWFVPYGHLKMVKSHGMYPVTLVKITATYAVAI